MLERIGQLRVALIPFPTPPPVLFPLFIAERLVLTGAAGAGTPGEQPGAEAGHDTSTLGPVEGGHLKF